MSTEQSNTGDEHVTHALHLVEQFLDKWYVEEPDAVGSPVWESLTRILGQRREGQVDDTGAWCQMREVFLKANAEGTWTHSRLRDEVLGALAGIEDPVPLTGVEHGDTPVRGVPVLGDVAPGKDCDDE